MSITNAACLQVTPSLTMQAVVTKDSIISRVKEISSQDEGFEFSLDFHGHNNLVDSLKKGMSLQRAVKFFQGKNAGPSAAE